MSVSRDKGEATLAGVFRWAKDRTIVVLCGWRMTSDRAVNWAVLIFDRMGKILGGLKLSDYVGFVVCCWFVEISVLLQVVMRKVIFLKSRC
jgi:hypothetical protein